MAERMIRAAWNMGPAASARAGRKAWPSTFQNAGRSPASRQSMDMKPVTVTGVARAPRARRAGSPGTTREMTKITMESPKMTNTEIRSRFPMYFSTISTLPGSEVYETYWKSRIYRS